MYRQAAAIVCAALLNAIPSTVLAQRPPAGTSFAIENVTVIDVTNGTRAASQNVVVRGTRIVAAGPASSVRSPAGIPVVDGRGKFLMPGLWDMHAHPYHNIPRLTLPLAVANGITGIREMGGGFHHMAEATQLIDGGLISPRMFVDGHLPVGMTIVEASDAGQRSVEHIGGPGDGDPRPRTFSLAVIKAAQQAGLRLLSGTDWPGGSYWSGNYQIDERSLHDELRGLVEAGLTPLEALRTSTVNPAILFGMADQLGRVSQGFLADMVLLDADPLVDISNTKRIAAVVANGRLIDVALRQRLIDEELKSRKPAQTR